MNYGSEPADQVVRYSLEGAEFALRISGTAAKNFFIFAQAVLHDSKKTHGKTHLIRLLKEQKPLKFFTVDKDRMHDFARAAKAHGLLFCPIRDKMDPDHIELAKDLLLSEKGSDGLAFSEPRGKSTAGVSSWLGAAFSKFCCTASTSSAVPMSTTSNCN